MDITIVMPHGPDPALLAPPSAKQDIRRIAGNSNITDANDVRDAVRECYRQHYEKKKLLAEKDIQHSRQAEGRQSDPSAGENDLAHAQVSSSWRQSLGRRVKRLFMV